LELIKKAIYDFRKSTLCAAVFFRLVGSRSEVGSLELGSLLSGICALRVPNESGKRQQSRSFAQKLDTGLVAP
jgi:hypothetical protein